MPKGVYKRGKIKRNPHKEETKIKIGIGNIGKTKGRKQSQTQIDKRVKRISGELSGRWKGGITRDINKYNRERNSKMTDEKKKEISWIKNKRNRLKKIVISELGTHTYGEWELLKKQYNYTCPCCKLSEPFYQKSKYLTEDHIIPLSKGGSDLIENIQPLCLSCNIKKHTLIIKY